MDMYVYMDMDMDMYVYMYTQKGGAGKKAQGLKYLLRKLDRAPRNTEMSPEPKMPPNAGYG